MLENGEYGVNPRPVTLALPPCHDSGVPGSPGELPIPPGWSWQQRVGMGRGSAHAVSLGGEPPCPPVPERVRPPSPHAARAGKGRRGRKEGGGRDGGPLGAAAPEAEPRVPVPGRAQTSRCPLGHPVPLQPSRSTRPASSSSSSSTLGEALVSSSCGTGLVLAHTSCPPERSPGSAASQRVAGREYWQSHLALRVPKPGITPPSGLLCPGGPAGSGRERERERRTQHQAGNRQEPAASRGPSAARGPRLSPPAPAR